jgi:hypothetical protein
LKVDGVNEGPFVADRTHSYEFFFLGMSNVRG